MKGPKMLKYITCLSGILLCLLFTGCVVNPATGENQLLLIGENKEMEIGSTYSPEVEKQLGGRLQNESIQNYVNSIGQKIVAQTHMADKTFRFTAVNDGSLNAVAMPGGYIFITKGLLQKLENEAQLAAVLGHEIAHVTAKHSAEAMSKDIGFSLILSVAIDENTAKGIETIAKVGKQMISLKYSRDDELQADSLGAVYIKKAGYYSGGMLEVIEILEKQSKSKSIEFFSTHPNPYNRKANLGVHVNPYDKKGKVGQKDYKREILDVI
jgi:predicted Zn-dependent protease